MSQQLGVILLTPTTLSSHRISISEKPVIESIETKKWQPGTLADVFRSLYLPLETLPIRLLVSDSLCYVFSLKIPAKTEQHQFRQTVAKIVEAKVPENLEDLVWDFKIINSNDDFVTVQIVVVSSIGKQLLDACINSISKPITAIEPLSLSLHRSLLDRENYFLLFQYEHWYQVLVVKDHTIQLVKHISEDQQEKQIKEVLELCKKRIDFEPTVLMASVKDPQKLPLFPGISWEEISISPFLNLASKTDIKGPDEKVLNIQLSQKTPDEFVTVTNLSSNEKTKLENLVKFWHRVVMATAVIGLIAGVGLSFILF